MEIYKVGNEEVSKQQLEEMKKNPNVKLVEISSGVYKVLTKLQG